MADAAAGRAAQGARLDRGRYRERDAGQEWRDAGRRFVPEAVRPRRGAVGAHRHRGARVPRGRSLRVHAEGRNGRGRAQPRPDRAGCRRRAPVAESGRGRDRRQEKRRARTGPASGEEREFTVADRGGYDIVILGGGSGGYACALRAAELGKRVALIEKGKVGGTCLHRGCIPTKALLHAAEIADHTRDSARFGVQATLQGIDMAGVNAYKDKVVTRLWKGLEGLIASRKIDVIQGDGRLVSPTSVQVGDAVYTGAHVVLASGSE